MKKAAVLRHMFSWADRNGDDVINESEFMFLVKRILQSVVYCEEWYGNGGKGQLTLHERIGFLDIAPRKVVHDFRDRHKPTTELTEWDINFWYAAAFIRPETLALLLLAAV